MDMVVAAGKSRKNVDAFVLLPPDAKKAIDVLITHRSSSGIPKSNPYIFARRNADTPLTGTEELRIIADSCPGLVHPERISSNTLRKYIATVSQILDMTDKEVEMLAVHLGHDVKTHKENYRLAHTTRELTTVAQLLLTVEKGDINKYKGQKLCDIDIDELPLQEEEDDMDEDGDDSVQGKESDELLDEDMSIGSKVEASTAKRKEAHVTASLERKPEFPLQEEEDDMDEDGDDSVQGNKSDDLLDEDMSNGSKGRTRWTEQEISVLKKHFGTFIKKGRYPPSLSIERLKNRGEIRKNRTVVMVKAKLQYLMKSSK